MDTSSLYKRRRACAVTKHAKKVFVRLLSGIKSCTCPVSIKTRSSFIICQSVTLLVESWRYRIQRLLWRIGVVVRCHAVQTCPKMNWDIIWPTLSFLGSSWCCQGLNVHLPFQIIVQWRFASLLALCIVWGSHWLPFWVWERSEHTLRRGHQTLC